MPASPSAWASSWKATGPTRIGISSSAPRTVALVETSGDVDQDPRQELPALVGLGVPPQGSLVAGAAGEVAVGARLELLCREPLEIGDVDRIGDARRLFRVRREGIGSEAHGGSPRGRGDADEIPTIRAADGSDLRSAARHRLYPARRQYTGHRRLGSEDHQLLRRSPDQGDPCDRRRGSGGAVPGLVRRRDPRLPEGHRWRRVLAHRRPGRCGDRCGGALRRWGHALRPGRRGQSQPQQDTEPRRHGGVERARQRQFHRVLGTARDHAVRGRGGRL